MPADNLEIFKKVIFRLPDLTTTLKLMVFTGLFYGLLLYVLLVGRLEIMFHEVLAVLIGLFLFIVPSAIASEAYSMSMKSYPRKWGYFLALVNQLVIFLFTALVAFSDNFSEAWNIIWLGLTTLYASNFFVLVLSNGPKYMKRISLLSLIQPLLILSGFHFFLGRYLEIGFLAYLSNFLIVVGTGIVLLLAFKLTDFLVGSNVDLSMISLATALLQNRQEKLDIGRKVRPDIHTLEIENSSGNTTFLAPWLHPGPLQGFGGGQITGKIIKELNRQGEGFFLHVPSCHQMDPSDPADAEKVLDASKSPVKTSKASEMLKKTYDFCTFYGRKYGDQRIVFLEINGFDDYDYAVFQDIIDKEEVMLVDLHNQPKGVHENEMRYGTVQADKAREKLLEFLDELEELPLKKYSAGKKIETGEKPRMALVEKTGDQSTVVFGLEGNDASNEMLELEDELGKQFDHALFFTTDTHSSIHELASEEQLHRDQMRGTVEEALKNVSEASAGFTVSKASEMRFLLDEYFGLIYSINILVRLIPLMLVFLYLLLVVWLV